MQAVPSAQRNGLQQRGPSLMLAEPHLATCKPARRVDMSGAASGAAPPPGEPSLYAPPQLPPPRQQLRLLLVQALFRLAWPCLVTATLKGLC